MFVPLTDTFLREAREFNLRSACVHCFFYVEAERRCAHEWPNEEQRRWPLDAPTESGDPPTEAHFCREFELA